MTRPAAAILIAGIGFAALAVRLGAPDPTARVRWLLPNLQLRPMHGDEAIHAVRFGQFWSEGRFIYDPDEYHGPTLYYLTLPGVLAGPAKSYSQTNETDYRIVPVFFGALLVLLTIAAAPGLGRAAAVWAAALTAVSPIMVYYSRYYIHEMPLAVFTFMTILCGWRWARTRRVGWAMAAGACAGLMHATKETAVLAWAAMGAGLLATWAWNMWIGRSGGMAKPTGSRPWVLGVTLGVLAGAFVSITLFSDFFRNLRGPWDSLAAYATYFTRAGGREIHDHPWWTYARWLLWTRYGKGPVFTELPIAILAIVGIGVSLLRREPAAYAGGPAGSSLPRFLAFYTLALTAIYAAIPYKTPWCALSFWHGAILMAGVGLAATIRAISGLPGKLTDGPRREAWVRLVAGVLLGGGAIGLLAWQAWRVNARFPADGRNPYVYAHPVPDVLRLVDRVSELAAVAPGGPDLDIRVVSGESDWWPLPWYFRHFDQERIGYFAEPPPPAVLAGDVIIAPPRMHEALGQRIDLDGYAVAHYGLRPQEILLLYVRKDLWERFIARRAHRSTEAGRP